MNEFEQLKSDYEGQLVEYRLHGSTKSGRIVRLSINSRTGKPNAHINRQKGGFCGILKGTDKIPLDLIVKRVGGGNGGENQSTSTEQKAEAIRTSPPKTEPTHPQTEHENESETPVQKRQSLNLQLLGKVDRSSRLSLSGEKFEYDGSQTFYSCPNNKFKVGDRVVWNYDRESGGEPPVGKVEFIGTVTVAVVHFDKNSSNLPGYLSTKLYGENTNVVKIQELEELKRWHRASQCSMKSLQDFINSTTPPQGEATRETPDAYETQKLKTDENISAAATKTDEDKQQHAQKDTFSKPTTSKNHVTPNASSGSIKVDQHRSEVSHSLSSPPESPVPTLPPKQNKKQLEILTEMVSNPYDGFENELKELSSIPSLLPKELPTVNSDAFKENMKTNTDETDQTVPEDSTPFEESISRKELQPKKEKSTRSRLPALVNPKSDLASPANENTSPAVETESARSKTQIVMKQSQIPRREPSFSKLSIKSTSHTPTSPPPQPSSIPGLST